VCREAVSVGQMQKSAYFERRGGESPGFRLGVGLMGRLGGNWRWREAHKAANGRATFAHVAPAFAPRGQGCHPVLWARPKRVPWCKNRRRGQWASTGASGLYVAVGRSGKVGVGSDTRSWPSRAQIGAQHSANAGVNPSSNTKGVSGNLAELVLSNKTVDELSLR
jgi:hypothetical protein